MAKTLTVELPVTKAFGVTVETLVELETVTVVELIAELTVELPKKERLGSWIALAVVFEMAIKALLT